jgi:hypothetical protein
MATVEQRQGGLARLGLERCSDTNGRRRTRRVEDCPLDERPAKLATAIKTMGAAWQEWADSIGGNKPVREFKPWEHTSTHSRCLPLCNLLARMVNAEILPSAIWRINTVCAGWGFLKMCHDIVDRGGSDDNGTLHKKPLSFGLASCQCEEWARGATTSRAGAMSRQHRWQQADSSGWLAGLLKSGIVMIDEIKIC